MMIRGGTFGDNKYVKLEQRYIHDQRWNTCTSTYNIGDKSWNSGGLLLISWGLLMISWGLLMISCGIYLEAAEPQTSRGHQRP